MANWQASDEIMELLSAYRPKLLPREAWKAIRDQVVAAVLAGRPRSLSSAKQAITVLVLLLSDRATWDRSSELNLPELLVASRTDAFLARQAAAGAKRSTLGQRRSSLNRLSRGVHGLPIDERRPAGSATADVARGGAVGVVPAAEVGALRALLAAGYPAPVAAAAWRQWSNHGVANPLRHVVAGLVPTATGAAGGTGPGAVGPVLHQLPEVSISGAPVATTPAGTGRPTPSMTGSGNTKTPVVRQSRAAALRHAKAQQAVLDQLEAAGRVQLDFDEASLAPEIVATYDRYSPHWITEALWRDLEEIHRRLVLGYRPASPGRVGNVATAVTTFLRYVHDLPGRDPGPVTAEQVLVPGLPEAWIGTLPNGTATSYRSLIRRSLDSLTPDASRMHIGYTPRPAPYTVQECRQFVRLVFDQPSIGRRRAGCLIVGLGLGAGLDGRDWRALRRGDIRDDTLADGTPVLVVDVPESMRPGRSVVIRALYEPLVRRGLAAHDEAGRASDALLIGEDEDRHSILDGRIRALTTARGGAVDIEAARLRNTWIVAALSSDLPLPAVMNAAGLSSARTITDLLPYCAEPDPAKVGPCPRFLDTGWDYAADGSVAACPVS